MKKLLFLLAGAFCLYSCATTKTSKLPSPVGEWEYAIMGTPEGDFKGVMAITQQEKEHKAVMISGGDKNELEKFVYNKETKVMTGQFYYSDTLVLFEATLEGDAINGTMSAAGMKFPYKATRKK